MPEPLPFDSPTRFLLRTLARGLECGDVTAITGDDGSALSKRLRAALTRSGRSAPPPSSGEAALLAAAAPLVDAARAAPGRRPATECPAPDVAAALARGGLAGPLLLATLEHAADCGPCLVDLVDRRRAPVPETPLDDPRRPARGAGSAALVVALVVGGALALFVLLG